MAVYFLQVGRLLFAPPCLLLIYTLLNNGLYLFPEVKREISQILNLFTNMIASNELSLNFQRLTIKTNK